jgi:hypothetical protein
MAINASSSLDDEHAERFQDQPLYRDEFRPVEGGTRDRLLRAATQRE